MTDHSVDRWRSAIAAIPLGTAPEFDLACVGTSIGGLGAFTFDGLACLAQADLVYYYPPTPTHFELMKLINKTVINMHETLYVRGREFDPVYDAIVNEVMNTVESGKRVAYAVQGSPAFHCGTAIRLHRLARRKGFKSIIIAGVSSFELISASLSEYYDITTLQMYKAGDLVDKELLIDPRVPCLVFDLSRYALSAVRERVFTPGKISVFAKRLQSMYSRDHKIILMHAGPGELMWRETRADAVEEALSTVPAGVTMFIPSISAE